MKQAPESMTDDEIQRAGYAALVRELGPAGMIRFVQMRHPGSGGYTKDRHAWLDHLTVDDVAEAMRRRRREQP